jgi:ATP adenylyltransferase
VSYEQLWAPWRLAYVADATPKEPGGCFLCRYRDENADARNFVVLRGAQALTVLNRFPYNNGHLLVAPLSHKAMLGELTDEELLECMHQLQRLTAVLQRVLTPDGFNIGLNLGQVAGAGLPGHLHWHIVPRWSGDTNFMPVLANVKVIPQSLETLHELLRTELAGDES